MYRSLLTLSFLAVACFSICGCANEPVAVAPGDAVATATPATKQKQQDEKEEKAEPGIGQRMSSFVQSATANAPSYEDLKKMVSDTGQTTQQTTSETMDWIREKYNSLSQQGRTTSDNVSEWVAEDWNSINAWEYKVLTVSGSMTEIEEKLNEAGMQRWDCFHVSEAAGTTKFFMKRQKKSYLKNIPLKDMLKLIPLLDGEQ